MKRPGRYFRVPQTYRRGQSEDHPGNLVQWGNARSRAIGRSGRGDPVLRTCEQPGHRQRRRLHLPYPDQRHSGGNRHRKHSVGGWGPQTGYDHRGDRLRRGCEAHFSRPVRETRRRDCGRGEFRFGYHWLQIATDQAVRREPRRAASRAPV